MNVFEAVKQSVTTRQAASYYGIRVGRNGMACCPFHNDRTPSMKVDSRYYCISVGCFFLRRIFDETTIQYNGL